MRHLVVAIAMLGSATHAFADSRGLEVKDVQAQLRSVSDTIEHCYLDRTADVHGAGHLSLVITVTRYGAVEALEIKTPGLASKLAKQIDGCIRTAVMSISFPVKKTFTTATIPYYFQRTEAPGAGPQLSCWNPAGCHAKS